MRVLGIDFGERRIGVAVSDGDGRIAVPVGVVERRNDRDAIAELRSLAADREAAALVVGMPTRADGTPGSTSERVRRFAGRLERAAALPVHFVDEALTSVEAGRPRSDGSRRGRRRPLDDEAACILLQDWLDREARS